MQQLHAGKEDPSVNRRQPQPVDDHVAVDHVAVDDDIHYSQERKSIPERFKCCIRLPELIDDLNSGRIAVTSWPFA